MKENETQGIIEERCRVMIGMQDVLFSVLFVRHEVSERFNGSFLFANMMNLEKTYVFNWFDFTAIIKLD